MLAAVLLLSTSIWVGGYIAIVVARAASATLDTESRIAFFRSLGRSYLLVGAPALLVALINGGIFLTEVERDGLVVAAMVVAVVLVVSFIIAVGQARRMTVLRGKALTSQDSGLARQVERGALAAGLLRAGLGVLSIALLVLGAFIAAG